MTSHPYTAAFPATYETAVLDDFLQTEKFNLTSLLETLTTASPSSAPDIEKSARQLKRKGKTIEATFGRLSFTAEEKLRLIRKSLDMVFWMEPSDSADSADSNVYVLSTETRTLLIQLVRLLGTCHNLSLPLTLIPYTNHAKNNNLEKFTFPWRTIYEHIELAEGASEEVRFLPQGGNGVGGVGGDSAWLSGLLKLGRCFRKFYPMEDDVTAHEVLEEFLPGLSEVHTFVSLRSLTFLVTFLPSTIESQQLLKSTFETLLSHYKLAATSSNFSEGAYLKLFHRLSKQTPAPFGFYDVIFPRIYPHLGLPRPSTGSPLFRVGGNMSAEVNVPEVVGKGLKNEGNLHGIIDRSARFWVERIGEEKGKGVEEFERFFRYISPYFHPSNYGAYSSRVGLLLSAVTHHLACRVGRSDAGPYCVLTLGQSFTPTEPLLPDTLERTASFLLPYAQQLLYSKSEEIASYYGATSIKNILTLSTSAIPVMMDFISSAITSVNETHQAPAALQAMPMIVSALLRPSPTEFFRALPSFFHSALRGVDTNDEKKTLSTLYALQGIFQYLPVGGTFPFSDDDNEDLRNSLDSAISAAGDFAVPFLDRVFELFSNMGEIEKNNFANNPLGQYQARIASMFNKQVVSTLWMIISGTDSTTFANMTRETENFLRGKALPHGKKGVSGLLQAFSARDPVASLEAFFNPIVGLARERSEQFLFYYIRLLSGLIKSTGSAILKYRDELKEMIRLGLESTDSKARKSACKLLRFAIQNVVQPHLTNNNDIELRRTSEKIGESPKQMRLEWWLPGKSELEYGVELLKTFLGGAMESLENILQADWKGGDANALLDNWRISSKILLYSLRGCIGVLLDEIAKGVPLHPTERATLNLLGELSVADKEYFGGLRRKICDLLSRCMERFATAQSDDRSSLSRDSKAAKMFCEAGLIVSTRRGVHAHKLKSVAASFANMKSFCCNLRSIVRYDEIEKSLMKMGGEADIKLAHCRIGEQQGSNESVKMCERRVVGKMEGFEVNAADWIPRRHKNSEVDIEKNTLASYEKLLDAGVLLTTHHNEGVRRISNKFAPQYFSKWGWCLRTRIPPLLSILDDEANADGGTDNEDENFDEVALGKLCFLTSDVVMKNIVKNPELKYLFVRKFVSQYKLMKRLAASKQQQASVFLGKLWLNFVENRAFDANKRSDEKKLHSETLEFLIEELGSDSPDISWNNRLTTGWFLLTMIGRQECEDKSFCIRVVQLAFEILANEVPGSPLNRLGVGLLGRVVGFCAERGGSAEFWTVLERLLSEESRCRAFLLSLAVNRNENVKTQKSINVDKILNDALTLGFVSPKYPCLRSQTTSHSRNFSFTVFLGRILTGVQSKVVAGNFFTVCCDFVEADVDDDQKNKFVAAAEIAGGILRAGQSDIITDFEAVLSKISMDSFSIWAQQLAFGMHKNIVQADKTVSPLLSMMVNKVVLGLDSSVEGAGDASGFASLVKWIKMSSEMLNNLYFVQPEMRAQLWEGVKSELTEPIFKEGLSHPLEQVRSSLVFMIVKLWGLSSGHVAQNLQMDSAELILKFSELLRVSKPTPFAAQDCLLRVLTCVVMKTSSSFHYSTTVLPTLKLVFGILEIEDGAEGEEEGSQKDEDEKDSRGKVSSIFVLREVGKNSGSGVDKGCSLEVYVKMIPPNCCFRLSHRKFQFIGQTCSRQGSHRNDRGAAHYRRRRRNVRCCCRNSARNIGIRGRQEKLAGQTGSGCVFWPVLRDALRVYGGRE